LAVSNKTEFLEHSRALWIANFLPEFQEPEAGMGETEAVVGHTKQETALVLGKLADVRTAQQDSEEQIAGSVGLGDLFPGEKGQSPVQCDLKKKIAERSRW
jgi:hypothetical protein